MRNSPLEDRFWAKVLKTEGCWLWQAHLLPNGYGRIKTPSGYVYAHRFSFELAKGPIPDRHHVDHACHSKACVRPEHLRAVTNKQNMENRSGPTVRSKSGARGVFFVGGRTPWKGQVVHHGKTHYLGVFPSVEEAEEAVVQKRNELFTHNDLDRVAK